MGRGARERVGVAVGIVYSEELVEGGGDVGHCNMFGECWQLFRFMPTVFSIHTLTLVASK